MDTASDTMSVGEDIVDGEGCFDRNVAVVEALRNGVCDTIRLDGTVLCSVDDDSLEEITKSLAANNSVTSLDLSLNKITDVGVNHLSRYLRTSTMIQNVCLDNNNITLAGIETLADALAGNRSIERLDLSSNNLGDEGALALARMLALELPLQILHVRFNEIGDLGMQALCHSLMWNTTLTSLYVSGNCVTDSSIDAIVALVESNTNLTELGLANNEFTLAGLERISTSIIRSTTSLQTVLLSHTGKRYLPKALQKVLTDNKNFAEMAEVTPDMGWIERCHEDEKQILFREISSLRGKIDDLETARRQQSQPQQNDHREPNTQYPIAEPIDLV